MSTTSRLEALLKRLRKAQSASGPERNRILRTEYDRLCAREAGNQVVFEAVAQEYEQSPFLWESYQSSLVSMRSNAVFSAIWTLISYRWIFSDVEHQTAVSFNILLKSCNRIFWSDLSGQSYSFREIYKYIRFSLCDKGFHLAKSIAPYYTIDLTRLLCKYYFHYESQGTIDELKDFTAQLDFVLYIVTDKLTPDGGKDAPLKRSASAILLSTLQDNKDYLLQTAKDFYSDETAMWEEGEAGSSNDTVSVDATTSAVVGDVATTSANKESLEEPSQKIDKENDPSIFDAAASSDGTSPRFVPSVADDSKEEKYTADLVNAQGNTDSGASLESNERAHEHVIYAPDLVGLESALVISLIRNEDTMVRYMDKLLLLKEYELQRPTLVKIQTCLHRCSRPGGPMYPTRRVRSKAREVSDTLFPIGRLLRKVVRVLFALWHPYYTASSLIYWTQYRVHSIFAGIRQYIFYAQR